MEFLLLAGGACIFFFAVAQLVAKNKQPFHYSMIVGSFAAGYLLLYFWAVKTGFIVRLPALVRSDISATFLAASAFYVSSLTILHEGKRPVRSYSVYFIAPVAFAVCFGFYNSLAAPAWLRELGTVPDHFSSRTLAMLTFAADFTLTGVIVLDLLAALRLKRAGHIQNRSAFRHQVIFLILYLAASLNLLASSILRDEQHYIIAFLIFSPIILTFGLSRITFVYFGDERVASVRRVAARPEWNSSAEELTERLDGLMENIAPYRDENLTVRRLAHLLGVEPRRLTYHLHATLATNFRTYINEWRLKAVCEELLRSPDRAILEIAFRNGFNSKSSFNTLFHKRYGKTPREFRRERGEVSV